MDDDLRNSLDKIFQHHEEKKSVAEQNLAKVLREEAEFLAAFKQLVMNVVQPVMVEVGEYLRSKGHVFRIENIDRHVPPGGRSPTTNASISMIILDPRGKRSPSDCPTLMISAETSSKRAAFYERDFTGGGPTGTKKLEDVTRDLIKERLLKVVASALQ